MNVVARTRRVLRACVAGLLAGLALAGSAAAATKPPHDPVSRAPVTWGQLVHGTPAKSLTLNRRLAAPRHPDAPSRPFVGTLKLAGAHMTMSPGFGTTHVLGKDTTFFPDIAIRFFTVGTHLVPTTQDVIPNGTLAGTRSFWDVIVQPGRVWRQHGSHAGWNRASFPFALVNRIEGETHTGIATFVYKGHRVSHVRFQIVAETGPYYVSDYFNAWGTTKAAYEPGGVGHVARRRAAYRRAVRDRFPVAPLRRLSDVGRRLLARFDGTKDERLVLQTGLLYRGVLYLSPCRFAAGPFPYCDATRYGVWSVTKTAMMNVAMLRLAQRYGTGLLDEHVADYDARFRLPGWAHVTFLDLANMASGHGATVDDPTCYLCDYDRWYIAPSEADKVTEALNYPLAWAPGTKYNYRDQDAYLLGVALESYLHAKAGPHASLSRMLDREVYAPIGIHAAPANRTIESGGSSGHLMLAYGYYPTLDDLAKIALLYEHHGAWHGRQILDRRLVDRILPKRRPPARALPKGEHNRFGPLYYAMNWHVEPYRSPEGCRLYLPNMEGWGGNLVTLMPGHVVALRMANAWTPPTGFDSTVPEARVGDRLTPFCG